MQSSTGLLWNINVEIFGIIRERNGSVFFIIGENMTFDSVFIYNEYFIKLDAFAGKGQVENAIL